MGNSLRSSKKAKVMKIDGETIKIKTPIRVGEFIKDYPGHVLIESESVKRFGIRAKPLESQQELIPKRIYFLLELPKFPKEEGILRPRRVRSGIQMNAKDRLESLMLSRRSVSDLSVLNTSRTNDIIGGGGGGGGVVIDETTTATAGRSTIRMRLPKSQVMKLVEESKDSTEAAEKIMDLFIAADQKGKNQYKVVNDNEVMMMMNQWKQPSSGVGSIRESFKNREKRRVGFLPLKEDHHEKELELVH